VREAIREAVAAFGPEGRSIELGSPATGEATFRAILAARRPMGRDGTDAASGAAAGDTAGVRRPLVPSDT
jgi:xanthine dehydrogenase large subunit